MMTDLLKKRVLPLFIAWGLCLFPGGSAMLHAQETKRIAVVLSSSIEPYRKALKGFEERLKESGIDHYLFRFYMDELEEGEMIREIKGLSPHMIHAVGTAATSLAKREFPDRPLVFSMVLNPVSSGLVEGMVRPGGNVTGASMDIPLAMQFSYIRKIVPGVKRIGVLYSEDETGLVVEEAEAVAKGMGLGFVKEAVLRPGQVPNRLKKLKGEIDFLWAVADGHVFTRETVKEILLVTLREKIPFMGLSPAFVKAGALFSMHVDPADMGAQAASIASRIFFGMNPGDIPVDVPERVKIVINRNTADILGINIPRSLYDSAEIIKPRR